MPPMPELLDSQTEWTPPPDDRSAEVAYFSMEVALDSRLPTYSGGLGVLAGDFLRSAADLRLPLVGVTMASRDGYFRQMIDAAGHQTEAAVQWDKSALLDKLEATVTVDVSGRPVAVGAWQLVVSGATGGSVPVIFLDTDIALNEASDRSITDQLYGGDDTHRLRQEAVLGLGGVAMLRELGYGDVVTFHMNEGHSSLLTLRLLEEEVAGGALGPESIAAVRARGVFTTHTPVPAGHDRFTARLVAEVLGDKRAGILGELGLLDDGVLNMTSLGVMLSGYVNAVARRHQQVTQEMMPSVDVRSITNGVHQVKWAAPPMRELFDKHLAGWRCDSAMLRYASAIPLAEVGEAHAATKRALAAAVAERTGIALDPSALTIGLARRVTPYKRTMLVFSDPARLSAIAEAHGPLQVVCSGKAHPRDGEGKEIIAKLVSSGLGLGFRAGVRVVFLENYDLELAGLLCAGADVWLNTPRRPLEASGTSGMKAAMNGVPSLSVLDGWWIEGCVEGVTGWGIGGLDATGTSHGTHGAEPVAVADGSGDDGNSVEDADALYEVLDQAVAPAYFAEPSKFLEIRRNAISLNGSFFSTDRMAREYAREAYGL
jgi:starch phosphorylase